LRPFAQIAELMFTAGNLIQKLPAQQKKGPDTLRMSGWIEILFTSQQQD
jgi:hypothetical protein